MSSDLIVRGPKEKQKPAVHLGKHFQALFQEYGHKVAQTQEIDGVEVSVTYSELLRHGKIVSSLLREHGLDSGDTVMLLCGNTLQVAPIMLGTLFVGAALAPVNPAFHISDMLHMINVIKPQVVICNEQAESCVHEALTQYNTPVVFITMEAVMKRLKEDPDVEDFYLGEVEDPDTHVAFVLCSSGTTGKPKGVELTHGGVFAFLPDEIPSNKEVTTVMNVSGPAWISCISATTVCLNLGIKMVLLLQFDVESFLLTIQNFQVNLVFLSPNHVVPVAKYASFEKFDLTSVSRVFYGGAPMSQLMLDIAGKRLNNNYIELGYGMTECIAILKGTYEDIGRPRNVGKLAANVEAKVVDMDSGKLLGANCEGELCFKTPTAFKGYRDNPQATKDIFDDDGFIHTGDIGYYDQDDYFYVIDRCKELFKHCGIHVPATDTEEVLLKHPDVSEAAVLSIDHEADTTHATAFVVPRPGSDVTEQELATFVQESLPSYKWLLGGVHFTDKLPRTMSGKVQKYELRKRFRNRSN